MGVPRTNAGRVPPEGGRRIGAPLAVLWSIEFWRPECFVIRLEALRQAAIRLEDEAANYGAGRIVIALKHFDQGW